MKKIMLVFIVIFFACLCAERSNITIEDGVEVTINRLEPSSLKGEPSIFSLEEAFSIDFGRGESGAEGS